MLNKKKFVLCGALALFLITLIPLCDIPQDPNDPSNTSATILLQTSKLKVSHDSLVDTAGNLILIGAALHLPENIDSVNLKILSNGAVVCDTILKNFSFFSRDTTIWKEIVFYTEGSRTVTLTPYSDIGIQPVSATIRIIGKQFPVNHAPTLTITGTSVINPSATCSLSIQASDEDPGQVVKIVMSDAPEGAQLLNNSLFVWTVPKDFIGVKVVTFTATDNGIPPLSFSVQDSIVASLDLIPPSITLIAPPRDSFTVSSATYLIDVVVSDASGIASVTAKFNGTTLALQPAAGHYTGTIDGLKAGEYNKIELVATDASPAGNKGMDTLYLSYSIVSGVSLKYDGNGNTGGKAPVDTTMYQAGAKATVKANTDTLVKTGSKFTEWNTKNDGSGTAYAPGATITMGTSDVVLYAIWTPLVSKPRYALTIAATNGSVTRDPDLSVYDSGTVVTLTPVPAANYHFTGWSGDLAGTANPETITMNSAKSVTASFVINPPNTFSLTVQASNGTVRKTPDLPQYDSGSSVGLKATANAGYKFSSWSGDVAGTTDSTTVVMNGAKSATANFTLQTYPLTVVAGTGGTVTAPAGPFPITVNHGAATLLTATPGAGYTFANWTVTAGTATIENAISATAATVTLGSGAATVTANFTLAQYPLTVVAGTGGTVTAPAGPFPITVNHGVATPLTATPGAGYTFANWTVTTGTAAIVNATSATTATVALSSGAATVTANFDPVMYPLTVTVGTGGTVNPVPLPSATGYASGTTVTLTANASPGYRFIGWSGDATGSNMVVTVIMTQAKAVTANFRKTYVLTLSTSDANKGTVASPSGASPLTVDSGLLVTINATPINGNKFKQWSVTPAGNAEIVSSTAANTTIKLTQGNATVQGVFGCVTFKKRLTFGGGGLSSVAVTDDGGYIVASSEMLIRLNSTVDTVWTRTLSFSCNTVQKAGSTYLVSGTIFSANAGMVACYAANGNNLWELYRGEADSSYSCVVAKLINNDYVIAGNRNQNFCLMEANSSRTITMDEAYDVGSADALTDFLQTNDGKYVLVGSADMGGKTCVLKVDNLGQKEWQCYLSANLSEFMLSGAQSVKITNDGDCIISGWGSNPTAGYLVKMSLTDTTQIRFFKKYSDLNEVCAVQPISGGYMLAGTTNILGTGGGADIIVAKTDASGNILNYSTYGTADNESDCAMQPTSDGGYIIVGENNWVIKTDENGSVDP